MATKFKPLDAREWLEGMLRFNSPDADQAKELLDLMDEGPRIDELAEWLGDFDEAEKNLAEYADITSIIECDGLAKEMPGETAGEQLRAALKYAAECEAFMNDVRDLCRQADLIGPNDETTDVLPLLQMFLPVD